MSNEDLEKYVELWEKACKEEAFQNNKKGISPKQAEEFLSDDDSTQSLYWNQLYKDSVCEEADNELRPNPVAAFSFGKDQDYPKVPDTESLMKLDDLKKKLHDIQCKLLDKEQGGKKWMEDPLEQKGGSPFSKEIEDLHKQIDELSDKVSGSTVKLDKARSPLEPDQL